MPHDDYRIFIPPKASTEVGREIQENEEDALLFFTPRETYLLDPHISIEGLPCIKMFDYLIKFYT